MPDPKVTIVTPTYRRDAAILARCLGCVRAQTEAAWRHVVCSDGVHEPDVERLLAGEKDPRFEYRVSNVHHGGFGAGVRQEVLTSDTGTEFIMFLDDDNVILPHYLEKMIAALDGARNGEQFAICSILHYGPLPFFMDRPPVILRGEPLVCQIDTLQVLVRTDAMREIGWRDHGYLSDGFTYRALGDRFGYVRVDDCLGIHF
ncbi:MAG TPA: glycosyltransferase [Gemmatimonadota bacterium]|nr:glycosyltransferase [Gemmatimonadota bacterium]